MDERWWCCGKRSNGGLVGEYIAEWMTEIMIEIMER